MSKMQIYLTAIQTSLQSDFRRLNLVFLIEFRNLDTTPQESTGVKLFDDSRNFDVVDNDGTVR